MPLGDGMKKSPVPLRVIRDHASKMRSKWRQVVTGDEKKKIREFIAEKESEPTYIRFFDKLAFTLGVLNIGVCQFFLLNQPEYFWLWYSLVMPAILVTRTYHFRSLGWQYFLFDFCYFTIFLTFIHLLLEWLHVDVIITSRLFRILFILTNGPLIVAIVAWRNSFVFHDYDKITSVYIHILPSMLYYCGRWRGRNSLIAAQSSLCLADTSLTFLDFFLAAIIYLFWQICYFIKTEVVDKEKLDRRPELLTSLRWLSKDMKNALANSVVNVCKRLRIYGYDEEPDPTSVKTKLVFIFSQFLYTLFTFIVTPPLYFSHAVNLGYIITIFTISIYNGASFYIDIFSKRYQRNLDSIKKLVQE